MKIKLKKELNLLDTFCIASGAMISSGLFILPGLAYARAGSGMVFSYFLAGLLAMTGMLSQAELVSAMPKAGGDYFYVTRSMGPAVGTVSGLMTWFSLSLKSSFALVGMAAFTALIVNVNIHIIAFLLCFIFIVINLIGIKEAGRMQIVLVLCLLAILLLYIVRGLPAINILRFESFAPRGLKAIFLTAGFVFISYGGLLKLSSIAEEVKNPGRTIPLAMILSFLVVSIFYILVVFVTTGVLAPNQLSNSTVSISDGAGVFMNGWGKILLSVAAILAFISTANAGIMSASRYPLALSRDGLLPNFLGRINTRFKTPHTAILLTALFIVIALFLKLDILVKVASTVLILTYIFSCLSVIVLREGHLQNYQPNFRSPLYPWLQIGGIVGFSFLILEMGKETLLIISIFIIGGFFIYWFYGRIRANREYALLHLIERITAKELTTHSLETELKEIIRERDDIIKDRFDRVIEQSIVIDIENEMKMEEFFQLVAKLMSERIKIPAVVIYKKLITREKESSTVISNALAIPHIIVDGKNIFDIILVRCRKGIVFSENAPKIHTVFILVGTKDERNFHLRALSAIAQIVQDSYFKKRWITAKNKENLRDIILLGKRKRQ
ncbi:MAG: hypothetical protein DRJ06_03970 [Candidatus Aminicenantes bacterium]|nr:MAG: hypothetical protein DRJ06_03970 [Candidatus Aminicenantes bacterium]